MRLRLQFAAVLGLLGLLALSLAVHAAPPDRSTSPVQLFQNPDGSLVAGSPVVEGSWSIVVRTDNSLSMDFHTTGLQPGAYTVWWGIFNNPDACTPLQGGCSPDDFFVPGNPAQATKVRAAGHIVGADGIGNFGGHVSVGQTRDVILGPGLLNPRGAVIRIVPRYHGPVVPEIITDQIHTEQGGCGPGLFSCYNPQISHHLPPE